MGKSKDNIAKAEELQPILEKIYNILKDKIDIKSLWMFRHVPQIYSFKSWGYLAVDEVVKIAYEQCQDNIKAQIIPENIGSIGKAFGEEKYHEDWLYIDNTYKAKEGTVIEIDLLLEHQSVLFVPFMDNKKSVDDKESVIAILLLSIQWINEKNKCTIQNEVDKSFKVSGINDLVQLAYQNEQNKDVIKNVKDATMDLNNETLPENFVRSSLIKPILEFNQGTSFVPIIEIEDKQHLQVSQWGYSNVVSNKLRQRLSEHITGKNTKDPSSGFIEDFINKCVEKREFVVDLKSCKITYMLYGGDEGVREEMEKASAKFSSEVESIIKDKFETVLDKKTSFSFTICEEETLWTIRKKYISEKLNQEYKSKGEAPFYLVLKGFDSSYFDKDELITSNHETLPLDAWRKKLIDNVYKYPHKYSSKTIPGLFFRVYTDDKHKDEEIFNDDVKAFIEQRCLYYKFLLEQRKAEKAAVRASIAQVMARNMSHNFGSHVLSNLIGDHVYEKLKDDEVKKEFEKIQRYIPLADVFKDDKDRQLPFFFQYLKSRMDYLSEVTFGVSNLLTTKMMFNDVMKELDQVRILLNYISGVSKFKYKFSLIYKDVDEDIDLTKKDVIGVAFPSDVLGCQAFYNIIENIIRNTAKHAKNNNDETVVFTITIKDNFAEEGGCKDVEGVDELYCVEIDNGVTEDNIDVLVNGGKDEYGKEIKGQNNRINDSVLEGQNLRSSSLGLLEMEASAAFLRQIDLPEIESEDYTVDYDDTYYHIDSKGKKRLNILKAFAIDEKVKERTNDKDGRIKVKMGRLGYRFFLQKPKEFLFVGDWKICEQDDEQEKAIRRQLLNCGIQFLTEEEFCTAMQSEKAFAHQFLIYQDISKEAKTYLHPDNDCKTLLPLRKLMVPMDDKQKIEGFWKGEENGTLDGKLVLQSLKAFAWRKFFEERIKPELKTDNILICSEKDPCKDNQVVFLDHGKVTNYIDSKQNNSDSADGIGEVWVENLTSRTRSKLPQFNRLAKGRREKAIKNYINNLDPEKEENEWIRLEIFEAYHNKVIVIDERVQKFAMKNTEGSGNDISSIDLHESTNVYVPRLPKSSEEETEDVFSLDPTDFSELKKKVVAFVNKHINDDNNKPIILVHYGILERMCGGNADVIKEILKNWAGEGKAKRVVVTSGRGSHSLDLPKSVCFLNLSSVLYAFNENRNKYIINNLLNQSRRKRNE